MTITKEHADFAVRRLSCIPYFPSDEIAREEIARVLFRLVDTTEHLNWLVMAFVDRIKQWHGPGELRAVYCTKFKPKDGVETDSSLAGFTADDGESDFKKLQPPRSQRMISAGAFELPGLEPEPRRSARGFIKQPPMTLPEREPTPVRTPEERAAEVEKLSRELARRSQ